MFFHGIVQGVIIFFVYKSVQKQTHGHDFLGVHFPPPFTVCIQSIFCPDK